MKAQIEHLVGNMADEIQRGKRPKGTTEIQLEPDVVDVVACCAKSTLPSEIQDKLLANAGGVFDQCSTKTASNIRSLLQKHHWVLNPLVSACTRAIPSTNSCLNIIVKIIESFTSNVDGRVAEALAFDLKAMVQSLRRIRRQWKYLSRRHKTVYPPLYAQSQCPLLVELVVQLEDPEAEESSDENDDAQAHRHIA